MSTPTPTPTPTVEALPGDGQLETNKRLVLKFLEMAFTNAMDEAITLLAEDVTWWVIGDPDRLSVAGQKNHVQTERLLRGLYKVLPEGMQFRVIGMTAEGDRVAVEVEAEGSWRHLKRYYNCYHFLFRVRNGRITAVREYLDTLRLFDMQ